MAVKNLIIRGGANFSQMQKGLAQAQRSISNFQSSVSSTMKKIGIALGGLTVGKLIKDSTQMAMSVEGSINQINRTMGTSAASFQNWVKTQAKSYGMATNEALQYGAVYSNLVSGFSKNTAETTKNTEDLLKASSIIASATGRSMEDVMERIRSGLLGNTEAIEDLGVYAQVGALEATQAFKKLANGKSWQQLDYQTQQQIRLMSILEQTTAKYGDTLINNTNYKQMMFIAQLKNAQLALGQAFLPIYNIILPALTNFVAALTNVLTVIAQFSQALFGSQNKAQAAATQKQAAAVTNLGNATADAGDKAKKAGKDAKGALAGFDEINSLSQGSNGGVGDGATANGGSVPNINTGGFASSSVEVSKNVQEMANKIKAVFADLSNFISKHKDIIISAIAGLLAGFAGFEIITNWSKIIETFKLAIEGITAALSGVSLPILLVSGLIALLVANIVYLWRTNEGFRNSVLEVWNQIKTFVTTVVNDMWSIVKGIWDKYGQTLMDNLGGFMKSIQDIIINVWEGFLKPIITTALSVLTELWNNHLKGLVQQVGEFIMKLINGALEIWNGFISPVVNWLIKTWGPIFADVFGNTIRIVGSILGVMADVAKGIFRIFGGIIDFLVGVFTGNWAKAWQGIKDVFGGIWDSFASVAKGPLNAVIGLVNKAISGVNGAKDILNKIPGVNIGNIPQIPKLAQGGYVSANSPMLAMIGDNRTEGEIVAPESKIYEQTYKAIKDAMGSNGDKTLVFNFNAGNSTIARIVIDSLNEYARQHGELPIPI